MMLRTMTKAALATAVVVIIPNIGLALEKIIAIVPAEARDLTVTTVRLDTPPEESAHERILNHNRNRHGLAAAAVARGKMIVTAVNVADVHDEVVAETTAAVFVRLPV
mmetsp:Transcript_5262/g.5488  ORF Transcript_5262/g.5488 Transcript_5262/m.5488 type:complete len:108 (-) Transcript_5262:423-746(-)